MRVISGTARGRKLRTLDGEDVRPTTDRVKEGMFSILQFDLPGARVLDLFAGSGQLGIEALSRGASICTFVDSSRKAQQIQQGNLQAAGLDKLARLVLADSISFLAGSGVYDIVLLDPPYRTDLLPQALQQLDSHLSPAGVVVCEHSADRKMEETVGRLRMKKQYCYGQIMLTTYRLEEEK